MIIVNDKDLVTSYVIVIISLSIINFIIILFFFKMSSLLYLSLLSLFYKNKNNIKWKCHFVNQERTMKLN